MSPDQIFSIANAIALLAWVLLAAVPGQRWVTEIVTTRVAPALFAVLYVAALAIGWGQAQGSFSTLSGVASLFTQPWVLLAGWLHYLAFDLLIGSWETEDARKRQVPRVLLIPCLFLTFMFGPAGWLAYMALRGTVRAPAPEGRPLRGRTLGR